MKISNANGMRGCLIYTGDTYLIRIYREGGEFKDFDIRHSDLQFIIDDEDCYLYENETRNWIDHSPDTLAPKLNKLL